MRAGCEKPAQSRGSFEQIRDRKGNSCIYQQVIPALELQFFRAAQVLQTLVVGGGAGVDSTLQKV